MVIGQLTSHETNRRRVSNNNNISQLLGDSFSVSQQPPSWDPCSHYSMIIPLCFTINPSNPCYRALPDVAVRSCVCGQTSHGTLSPDAGADNMGHGTTIQLHCIGTWYNAVVYTLSSTLGHGPHCLHWPGLGTWTLDNGLYGPAANIAGRTL